MKKIIYLLTILLICNLFAIPFAAASEEPVITLHPQSPNYPENSVAIYTVKAQGANLTATWYMEWQGNTYNISNVGVGEQQPWEGFAGASYGARALEDNTFIYLFEGIQYDLDGAYIWCVLEDGHYDVTTQKNRISVGNENMPPEILSIPTELVVELDDLAEIRCVAKSSDESQLSFLWYETVTGKREDIEAVNEGEETTDYLICDTSKAGTRNYICKVESDKGGITYSSVVSVTVTEKEIISADPDNSHEEQTEPTQSEAASTQTTDAQTSDTETAATQTAPLTTQTDATSSANPSHGTEGQGKDGEFPLWATILLTITAAGVGFSVALILMKIKSKKS